LVIRIHLFTGEGCHLAGYADYREQVGAVGGDVQVEDGIAHILAEGGAHRGIGRQYHDALMALGDTQLPLGADHARRFYAAYLRLFELQRLTAVSVYKLSADAGESNLLAGGDVGSATDDRQAFPPQIDGGQPEAVGLGMGLDGQNLADDGVLPAADGLHRSHLGPGHGEPVGQFAGGDVDIDVFF
jgi:hypothetical protein